ncbi:hypothetical protein [Priestia flexa]|nr:hypothetical protein [Priestia flexa]MBY6087366.1 hypothetical protein [Priestia flexa]
MWELCLISLIEIHVIGTCACGQPKKMRMVMVHRLEAIILLFPTIALSYS